MYKLYRSVKTMGCGSSKSGDIPDTSRSGQGPGDKSGQSTGQRSTTVRDPNTVEAQEKPTADVGSDKISESGKESLSIEQETVLGTMKPEEPATRATEEHKKEEERRDAVTEKAVKREDPQVCARMCIVNIMYNILCNILYTILYNASVLVSITVVAPWTAGQKERSILHLGHG